MDLKVSQWDKTNGQFKTQDIIDDAALMEEFQTESEAKEAQRQTDEEIRKINEDNRVLKEAEREVSEEDRIERSNRFSVFEEYNPSKPYEPLNKVSFMGSSFVNQLACTGIAPNPLGNNTNWLMIASKGNDGFASINEMIFTATANNTTHIVHNLQFNPLHDKLEAYGGEFDTELVKDENYTENADNLSIDLVGWSLSNGQKIKIKIYNNLNEDTIEQEIQNAITAKNNLNNSIGTANTTKTNLDTSIANGQIGNVTELTTQNKTNLVAAINENTSSLAEIVQDASNLESNKAEKTVVNTNYTRLRNEIRRKYNQTMYKLMLPTEYLWQDAPISIYTDGNSYQTTLDVGSYKVTGGTTYYVDIINGLDTNNGLTEGTALKTVNAAYGKCVNNDTIMIISPEGSIFSRSEWGERYWRKQINIISKNKVNAFGGDKLTFSKTSGYNNIYQSTRSGVAKVIDINYIEPVIYTKVSDLATCESTAGSWYTDNVTVYIHTPTHIAPNEKVLSLMTLSLGMIDINNTSENMKIYLENINFYGGKSSIYATNNASYLDLEVYAKKCGFYCNVGDYNVVTLEGTKLSVFQNCVAKYAERDGFNYHIGNGIIPKFIEIDCIGANNGNNDRPSPNTFNGSTAHDGVKGIRLNGTYYSNLGGNIVDVATSSSSRTQTINLGCKCFDSRSVNLAMNVDYAIQSYYTDMWLYGCIGFGSNWSINVNSQSTVYVDSKSEYDSSTGNGTISVI